MSDDPWLAIAAQAEEQRWREGFEPMNREELQALRLRALDEARYYQARPGLHDWYVKLAEVLDVLDAQLARVALDAPPA